MLKESKFLGVHVGSTNEFNGVLNELEAGVPARVVLAHGKELQSLRGRVLSGARRVRHPVYVNRAASYGRRLNFATKGTR